MEPAVALLAGTEPDQLLQLGLAFQEPLGGQVADLGQVACLEQLGGGGWDHVGQLVRPGG